MSSRFNDELDDLLCTGMPKRFKISFLRQKCKELKIELPRGAISDMLRLKGFRMTGPNFWTKEPPEPFNETLVPKNIGARIFK